MGTASGTDPDSTALWSADHVNASFNDDITDCRGLISHPGGPQYVAHSTYGLLDFAVGLPGRWPGDRVSADVLEHAGSQMSLMTGQLNAACDPLDTGPLIRVVVQGDRGALYEVVKVPGQDFFGVLFDGDQEAVDQADQRLAEVARRSVRRMGGTTLNWGGFRRRQDSEELWVPYRAAASNAAAPEHHTVENDRIPRPVSDACLAALAAEDLHAIGIYRQGWLVWEADIFEAQALAPLFQRVTPELRRRAYARLAHQVQMQSRRLTRLLDLTGSTRLARLVLDVARGAMYALPLGADEYLVGVTLVQSQVDQTDQKVRDLQSAIHPVWPSGGIGPYR